MSRIRLILAMGSLLSCTAPVIAATTVSFDQLNFLSYGLDGLPPVLTERSDWGMVSIQYTGEAQPLYFNLMVNDVWQGVNIPLAALDGIGAETRLTYKFDLGNSIGTRVESLSYGFSVTETAISTAPIAISTASVGERTVTFTGGLGEPGTPAATPPPPPPPPKTPEDVDGEPGWDKNKNAYHDSFLNQSCQKNHCVPTAMSNSLKFLNDKHELGIDSEKISPEKMAEVLGTTELGTDPVDKSGKTFIQKKDQYLRDEGIRIRTRTTKSIDEALEAIRDGKDVEIWMVPYIEGQIGHFVAITGIWKYADDRYGLALADDFYQDPDIDPEWVFAYYDPKSKLITEYQGRKFYRFVIESVVPPPIPEPGTWMLLISGFGLMGWRLRRQRTTALA